MDHVNTDASRAASSRQTGYLLLAIPIILWTCSSFISNAIFTDFNYPKPFFAAYLNTASFVLYLLPKLFRRSKVEETAPLLRRADDSTVPFTDSELSRLARVFCIIWFASNLLGNLALGLTSVSSMTILTSLSGLFTLIFGVIFTVERFTITKLLAVLSSILGVVLLSRADSKVGVLQYFVAPSPRIPKQALLGDVFALGAALTYAVYTVWLKARCGDERRISMTRFFGYVGGWNIIFLLPILAILHWTKLETFELPRHPRLIGSLLVNAAFTFIGDMCMMAAMLRTSPLAVTLGLACQIPLSVAGDLWRGTQIGGAQTAFGAVLIILAFVIVGLADANETESHGLIRAAVQDTP